MRRSESSEKRSVRLDGTGRMVSAFDSLAYCALLRIVVFAQLPFLVKTQEPGIALALMSLSWHQ